MSKKRSIAVITDSQELLQDIKSRLASKHAVEFFRTPIALDNSITKEKKHYDLIVSDSQPNDPGGISFKRKLQTYTDYPNVPFVLVVDRITNDIRTQCRQANISDFIEKPVDIEKLSLIIESEIETHENPAEAPTSFPEYKLPMGKRIFDVLFAGFTLLMLLPLFLIIAILIKISSKGPVFYYSKRVGVGAKEFKFWKFRSMYPDADKRLKDLMHLNQYASTNKSDDTTANAVDESAEATEKSRVHSNGTAKNRTSLYADGGNVVDEDLHINREKGSAFFKIKDDPRITPIGKFIRNTSIDELPQLWNVIIGDMSIVGNRPLPVSEFNQLTSNEAAPRFMAPAGITGKWQVEKRGKGEMSEEERLQLDNDYAKEAEKSGLLWYDIKLILKTIPALLQKENV